MSTERDASMLRISESISHYRNRISESGYFKFNTYITNNMHNDDMHRACIEQIKIFHTVFVFDCDPRS